jgi:hypothetical protein
MSFEDFFGQERPEQRVVQVRAPMFRVPLDGGGPQPSREMHLNVHATRPARQINTLSVAGRDPVQGTPLDHHSVRSA